MYRLALAVFAALTIHFLFLMIILPEPEIEKTKLRGSGHVTVNITRSVHNIEPTVSEEMELENEVQFEQLGEEKTEVIKEKAIGKKNDPVKPEPIKKVEPEIVVIRDVVHEKREVSEETKSIAINNSDSIKEINRIVNTRHQEVTATFSETETLQSPEPIQNKNKPPKYPLLARKRGWEGTVILEVDILSSGIVRSIQVKQSSSYELLDNEAMKAVRKWHFHPGSRGGKFEDMKVLVPVHFILQEQ